MFPGPADQIITVGEPIWSTVIWGVVITGAPWVIVLSQQRLDIEQTVHADGVVCSRFVMSSGWLDKRESRVSSSLHING